MNDRTYNILRLLPRKTLVSLLLALLIALPPSISFSPLSVRPAHADDHSMNVECPDPIT